ncbi:hypothetical protein GC173_17290 [bacterium]|nr:hypothetical protein [bacterium]
MARPVPYSIFLTDLARWVQANLKAKIKSPALLAAEPWAPFALVAGWDDQRIHVLDRSKSEIVRSLSLPPRIRKGTDFRRFTFSADGLNVAGYNPNDASFAAWSLASGELIHSSDGVGRFQAAMAFMPGGRLALCDGPRIHTFLLGGELLYTTPVSDDLRSLLMFSPPTTKPTLCCVAVFRKGLGGHHLHTFVVEHGEITQRREGPYRARPEDADDNKTLALGELVNIPGSTERILVVTEEERLDRRARVEEWEWDDEYKTRLLAVDPRRGMFYPTEIELKGRHCLQIDGTELLVIDERGFKRRLTGVPLRIENADWRLTG